MYANVISSDISYIYPTVAGGANTTFIVVIVIVVVSVMAAVSVFLALKYKSNSTEITPSAENARNFLMTLCITLSVFLFVPQRQWERMKDRTQQRQTERMKDRTQQ